MTAGFPLPNWPDSQERNAQWRQWNLQNRIEWQHPRAFGHLFNHPQGTPEPLAIFPITHRAPQSLWPTYQSPTEHPRAFGHLFNHIQSTPEPSALFLMIRVPPKMTDPSAIEHLRVFILLPHHPQGTLKPLESLTFFLKNQLLLIFTVPSPPEHLRATNNLLPCHLQNIPEPLTLCFRTLPPKVTVPPPTEQSRAFDPLHHSQSTPEPLTLFITHRSL